MPTTQVCLLDALLTVFCLPRLIPQGVKMNPKSNCLWTHVLQLHPYLWNPAGRVILARKPQLQCSHLRNPASLVILARKLQLRCSYLRNLPGLVSLARKPPLQCPYLWNLLGLVSLARKSQLRCPYLRNPSGLVILARVCPRVHPPLPSLSLSLKKQKQ